MLKKKIMKILISNGSKKRCREKFNYKGIGSLINSAVYLIEYDVDIAKNYLTEKELHDLNRIVTMYLDYAERQVK